ncbi:MAG: hypothetical protein CL911_02940 [Deltaproteobacteria bacterium]|nr:hypothetical protein [Deltaproteobacteria bacterium]
MPSWFALPGRKIWWPWFQSLFWCFSDLWWNRLVVPNRIQTPMLVLGGEQDSWCPWMTHWTGRLFHAETEVLPTLAHAMMENSDWQVAAGPSSVG